MGASAIIKTINDHRNVACLSCVIITIIVFELLTFNKITVLSEGWFITFANMNLSGKIMYKDYEFALAPLYTYLTTAIVASFGDSIIVFRIIGIIVYVVTGAFIYLILKEIVSPVIAAMSTLLAVFIMQSEVAFIEYDYVRIYDLFALVGIYIMTRVLSQEYNGKLLSVSGLFISLSILTRQTSGILVAITLVIFLSLMIIIKYKVNPKDLKYFLAGLLPPIIITITLMILIGAFGNFVDMTIFAGTKGSIPDMLFNWIIRLFEQKGLLIMGIELGLLLITIIHYKGIEKNNEEITDRKNILLLVETVTIIISLIYFIPLSANLEKIITFWMDLTTPVFIACLSLMIYFALIIITNKKTGKEQNKAVVIGLLLTSFIFATCYGAGTSAGISLGEAAFGYGFICSIVLLESTKIKRKGIKIPTLAVCTAIIIIMASSSIAIKVEQPFSWWGLSSCQYDEATEYLDNNSYFKGILMSTEDKDMYEDFITNCNKYLTDGDAIYCYAQIPVFYTLSGINPTVKAPIPWFDVTRDSTLLEDLDYLKNNNPKMIVFADHGEYVIRQHEIVFRDGGICGQRYVYEWIKTEMENGDYETISEYHVQNYTIYLLLLSS